MSFPYLHQDLRKSFLSTIKIPKIVLTSPSLAVSSSMSQLKKKKMRQVFLRPVVNKRTGYLKYISDTFFFLSPGGSIALKMCTLVAGI